jgi:uncharacterized protein
MMRLTKLITAVTFAVSIPTFGAAASFNCAKASTANEIAICSDDELSTLDETLAAVYKQARGSVSDAKRLKTEQVNWIKSLGTCNGNVDCLISGYRNRVLVLDYLDGQVTATLDPLQDQVAQLNEREEILALRENALTTELRALNSALDSFEEEKRQFYEAKGDDQALASTSSVEQTTSAAGKSVNEISSTRSLPNDTLQPYSSKSFDYTPCSDWPLFKEPQEIQNFQTVLVNLIDTYNAQPGVDMKMRYPNSDFCMVSIGHRDTLLAGVTSAQMWVNNDHFICSVMTENCQGDLAGYYASMTFYPGNRRQFNINTYRSEDALYFCYGADGLENGRCVK